MTRFEFRPGVNAFESWAVGNVSVWDGITVIAIVIERVLLALQMIFIYLAKTLGFVQLRVQDRVFDALNK